MNLNSLKHKKIGVAATRKADAITKLIQKNGGTAIVFPIQGEQQLNEETSVENVKEFVTKPFDVAFLTTGIGAEALEKAAHKSNDYTDFLERLQKTNLICRGSKTMNWLKKHALSPSYVSADGTIENLLSTLEVEKSTIGKRLFLQAYHQDDALLKDTLEDIGYTVYLSKPYRYKEPDPQTLTNLRQAIIQQSLDAVIFTSKTQVKNLFNRSDKIKEIAQSFDEKVLAVAVGKVTASELKEKGIFSVFQPTKPKMGAMVVELGKYYRQLKK